MTLQALAMHAPSRQLLRSLCANLSTVRSDKAKSVPHRSAMCPVCLQHRAFTTGSPLRIPPSQKPFNPKLQSQDRGPPSEENTQTDFRVLDIYSNTATPATAIDACLPDGFHINNGVKITQGDGVLLLGGEAYAWRPWRALSGPSVPQAMLATTGALDLNSAQMFGLLSLLHPLPDLLIIGTGASTRAITKQTRTLLATMGVKVDVMDSNNAAASFNLLSTERGMEGVAAAMLPAGWKGS